MTRDDPASGSRSPTSFHVNGLLVAILVESSLSPISVGKVKTCSALGAALLKDWAVHMIRE